MSARESTRARRLRRIAGVAAGLAGALALIHLARWSYYGELFPNTFYLKLTGWSVAQRFMPGLTSLFWVGCQFGVPALLAVWGVVERPQRRMMVLVVAIVGTLAFQVYIGGDAWSLNRFVVQIVPALAVLAASGACVLLRRTFGLRRGAMGAGAALVVAALIVAQNAAYYPSAFLLAPVHLTLENQRNLRIEAALQRSFSRDAIVAVGFAGAVPYFGDWRCVDVLGKCEAHIARLPVRPGRTRPGHNKQDVAYVVRAYQPDVFVNMLDPNVRGVETPYSAVVQTIDGDDVVFWVRSGSTKYRGGGELISAEEAKRRFVQ